MDNCPGELLLNGAPWSDPYLDALLDALDDLYREPISYDSDDFDDCLGLPEWPHLPEEY